MQGTSKDSGMIFAKLTDDDFRRGCHLIIVIQLGSQMHGVSAATIASNATSPSIVRAPWCLRAPSSLDPILCDSLGWRFSPSLSPQNPRIVCFEQGCSVQHFKPYLFKTDLALLEARTVKQNESDKRTSRTTNNPIYLILFGIRSDDGFP